MTHCTQPTHLRCWEHYQGFHTRAMERDVDLALGLLDLYLANSDSSIEAMQRIIHAASLVIGLRQRQWREMVREPFNFKAPEPTSQPRTHTIKHTTHHLTLDDLD